MCEINTFVFFDTETTGLPQFGPTKLTELALIACSREHLLTVKNNEIPRILHKLLLSVNPMKLIALEATKITGESSKNIHFHLLNRYTFYFLYLKVWTTIWLKI